MNEPEAPVEGAVSASPDKHWRYNHSEKGRARSRRYEESEKGRARTERYETSEHGRAVNAARTRRLYAKSHTYRLKHNLRARGYERAASLARRLDETPPHPGMAGFLRAIRKEQ